MAHILDVIDATGRRIRLPKKQWAHLTRRHSFMAAHIDDITEALQHPDHISASSPDPQVRYYYRWLKPARRYLLVIVKYLNGHGFIISAYRVRRIQ